MINAKLQNIIDTKSAIGNAIVNKGGTITSETPFFNYAAQIDGISTGTPQTIFAASDGSKWALTNAVNLVNDAGNVTSDFNYWQPANNSTSDPILNIGTVGANISGNIRLVPVNQVNIAQYVNLVATDTDGAKYEGFNGYDSVTNPTPTGNTTFNRWLLNNSATGTVIFANATFTTGTYNGPNSSINEANMPFVGNTANFGGIIRSITTNNGFIYVGGQTNTTVQKFHESNLAFVGNTVSYGGIIASVITNNGFIYASGYDTVQKFHESNLAFVGNTAGYEGSILSFTTNNGFIFAGGDTNQRIHKFFESNLARATGTNVSNNFGGSITTLKTNNGFIFAGGEINTTVQKFHESNLAFVSNTVSYGGPIYSVTTNNGFIYAGGSTNTTVQKFHESNLVFVNNTAAYGGGIETIKINNGFIYAGGRNSSSPFTNCFIQKFYESNLVRVGNTVSYGGIIRSITTNNGFIYAGGHTNQTVQKFQEKSETPDNQTFFTATKIKE
jgi:hypothetical protein